MKKYEIVALILGERLHYLPSSHAVSAFAPSNIALCKYWGKRDTELNLPENGSLSVSLGNKGTTTTLKISEEDCIIFNHKKIDLLSPFGKRLIDFLNVFRKEGSWHLEITTESNIPIAAGLASSASGFASFVLALNQLCGWNLTLRELSILARLGSGSACRSLWSGFVEWQMGERNDGMDSHGVLMDSQWETFGIGLLIVNEQQKKISSRDAMEHTKKSSFFYPYWPKKARDDLMAIKTSIIAKDFEQLGKTAESNALAMHAMMLCASPPISYCLPETMAAMHTIWQARGEGLSLYFTQDAGPNLKLLFLKKEEEKVQSLFPDLQIVYPFSGKSAL